MGGNDNTRWSVGGTHTESERKEAVAKKSSMTLPEGPVGWQVGEC